MTGTSPPHAPAPAPRWPWNPFLFGLAVQFLCVAASTYHEPGLIGRERWSKIEISVIVAVVALLGSLAIYPPAALALLPFAGPGELPDTVRRLAAAGGGTPPRRCGGGPNPQHASAPGRRQSVDSSARGLSKFGVRRCPTNPKRSEAVRRAGGTASLRFGFVPRNRLLNRSPAVPAGKPEPDAVESRTDASARPCPKPFISPATSPPT
jgi:hypothetical protein